MEHEEDEGETKFDWGAASPRERDALVGGLLGRQWWKEGREGHCRYYLYGKDPHALYRNYTGVETTAAEAWANRDAWCYSFPKFTSDAHADNSIREAIRGKDATTIRRFYIALWRILYEHWKCSDEYRTTDFDDANLYPMNFYEVGDYSHAAYLALTDSLDKLG